MVKRETVEHFTHVEADFARGAGQSLSYLFEHGVVVDVDFNKWTEFAIDKSQIAICAVIWAAV